MNKHCISLLLVSVQISMCSMLNMTSLSDTGVACTDHSDCTVLGHRYGCLLYRCTDYTDTRLVHCTEEKDCCATDGEDTECVDEHKYTCVR